MTIKVAVIGLGKMGLSHLAMVNALDDFEVVAICDSSAMVGQVIEKYGRLHYASDFEAVLRLPALDAILIATPSTTHAAMVTRALERGLHVFCEKPLTLSAADSAALSRMAASKGLVAQVGYHNRFIGTFGEVKRLLATGALGRVSHVLAEAYGPVVLKPAKPTWRGKAGEGGGCLYDYAAHPLNLVNWFFGRPVGCTGALLKRGFSAEVEDEVYATLGFADGVTAQASVNWSDPSVRKMTTRISIWGEHGKIFADRQEVQAFLCGASLPEGYEEGWTVRYITDLTPPVSFYLRGEEYTAQLESFGRAIRAGRGQAEENGFLSGAETDATIELIRDAISAGGSAGMIAAAAPPPRRAGLVGRIMGR